VHLVFDTSTQRLIDEETADDDERQQNADRSTDPEPPPTDPRPMPRHGFSPRPCPATVLPSGWRTTGAARRPGRLPDSCSWHDDAVGLEQHHLAGLVVGAEHEHLGHERPDLLGREVHDRDDGAADQVLDTIVPGDLSAGALDADR